MRGLVLPNKSILGNVGFGPYPRGGEGRLLGGGCHRRCGVGDTLCHDLLS